MNELLCIVSSVMMLFSLQPVSAHRSYGKETITATDTVMVSDEFRYVGQWPSGHGVLYHEYEGLYIGEFVNARPHGIIRHDSPYGHRYYGEYSEGKKQGHSSPWLLRYPSMAPVYPRRDLYSPFKSAIPPWSYVFGSCN
mgnify:CR=1 FL=1